MSGCNTCVTDATFATCRPDQINRLANDVASLRVSTHQKIHEGHERRGRRAVLHVAADFRRFCPCGLRPRIVSDRVLVGFGKRKSLQTMLH